MIYIDVNKMNKNELKIIIFILVGGISALIDVGGLYILNKLMLLDGTISVTIAFMLGLIFNYFCHTYFTFNKSVAAGNLIKYLMVVLINYLTTVLLIYLMQAVYIDIIIAKVITLPIVAVITFLLSNKWVYK